MERPDREVWAGCSGSLGPPCWQAAALGWNAFVNEKSLWLRKREETSYSGRDWAGDCARPGRCCSDSRSSRGWRHRAEIVLHDPHPLGVQAGKLRLESHSQSGAKSVDVVCADPLGQGLTMCSFDKHEGIAQHQKRSWEGGWASAGSPRLPPRSSPGRAAPPPVLMSPWGGTAPWQC